MRSTSTLMTAALTAAMALGAAAQTRDSAPTPQNRSIVTAEATRVIPPDNNKNAEDVEFLTEALRTSLAEVKMGELAAQRGHDPRVREYGTKLKADHAAQAAEIERMLKPLNVTTAEEPSAEAETHHAALARLSGEQFDAAFVDLMIESHREAIEKFGAQTHANPDRALHDFAANSLPVLREHLQTAESLR